MPERREPLGLAYPTGRFIVFRGIYLQTEVGTMRTGCGLRVHRVDGNEYLYFWHYEREGGRSRRREEYVGPAREPASRQGGVKKLPAYERRIQTQVASMVTPMERVTVAIRTVSC